MKRRDGRVITFATADPAWALICAIARMFCTDEAVAGGTVDVGFAGKSKVTTSLGFVES